MFFASVPLRAQFHAKAQRRKSISIFKLMVRVTNSYIPNLLDKS